MSDPSQSDLVSSFTQPAVPVGEPALEPTVSNENYHPGEPPQRRHYSEWDPRSAPGTYFLLAINVAVFVWMILHGV